MDDIELDCELVDTLECQVQVLVLYDTADGAFLLSAQLIKEMYKSLGAQVTLFPSIYPQITEKINILRKNQRIVFHYIGHGSNNGKSVYPSISVLFIFLHFCLNWIVYRCFFSKEDTQLGKNLSFRK
jgi:hypothetical protein